MNLPLILNLLVFLALLFGLAQTRHTTWSLAKKVLLALVLGVAFFLAQLIGLAVLAGNGAIYALVARRRSDAGRAKR